MEAKTKSKASDLRIFRHGFDLCSPYFYLIISSKFLTVEDAENETATNTTDGNVVTKNRG